MAIVRKVDMSLSSCVLITLADSLAVAFTKLIDSSTASFLLLSIIYAKVVKKIRIAGVRMYKSNLPLSDVLIRLLWLRIIKTNFGSERKNCSKVIIFLDYYASGVNIKCFYHNLFCVEWC